MNFNTMSAMLGRRLNDESASKFGSANRIDAVNNAMYRIANMLDIDMLEELRQQQTVSPSAGAYTLSGLTVDVLRNGIEKVYDVTNSRWLHLVDPKNLEKQTNAYLTPSANYGIAYVYGSKLYVAGGTISSITIWYLGQPTEYDISVTDGSAGDPANDCPLNTGLHPLVVDFAEAELWKQDGKGEKADAILKMALQEVATLNERATQERKEELGKQH